MSSPAASPSALIPRSLPTFSKPRLLWRWFSPLTFMHLACLSVFFVPGTTMALILCGVLYFVRMFAITAGYHRYFAHRAYKTNRVFQFFLACLGCTAMQRGPLWWASHHRDHHRYSDTDLDPHSPVSRSVWWSHVGWLLSKRHQHTDLHRIHDFARYPELRWLEYLHWVPGLFVVGICYAVAGLSGIAWGFFVSTMILYHGTFLVNSVCHIFGRRRYPTADESRNNAAVAIVTLGEGWHNNHHRYPCSANQGFYWWEVDISYSILRFLSLFGIVWDLRKPPLEKLQKLDASRAQQSALKPKPANRV